MASRVGLVAIVAIVAIGLLTVTASAQPASDTAIFTVRADPRLCPSPLCGGYWVALANGTRTRCADGATRAQCYVAKAVDQTRRPLDTSIPDGGLTRASLDAFEFDGVRLGVIVVATRYAPVGDAAPGGGYYRLVDTGIRLVRAPCFSLRATQVNGSTRILLSGVDLAAAGATAGETARARAALSTKGGLLARGRFARTGEGGREFRATRLYLRALQPRA